MARHFPKADLVAKGENPNGFRSVGGDGVNHDPTESQTLKPSSSITPNPNGARWSQLFKGERDTQGKDHDY